MPTIEELITNLEELKATIQDGVDRAMVGDSFDIAEINREQLLSGLDANVEELGQYAERTKAIRSKRGLQTEFIDLSFTGGSQKGLEVKKIDDKNFELSTNPRWDEDRFPDAIGIQEKNEDKVTNIVIENIEAVLNQKFT
jgi:hypothetical protein